MKGQTEVTSSSAFVMVEIILVLALIGLAIVIINYLLARS